MLLKDVFEMYYGEIRQLITINTMLDIESTNILSERLNCTWHHLIIKELTEKISGKTVLIFGAGPTLKQSILKLKPTLEKTINITLISADGATKALVEENIIPDIVVTDLDGDVDTIFKVLRCGKIIIVHAHGDNIINILKHSGRLKGKVLGSTQITPLECIENFGGFTDGDRALFIALKFGAKKVLMVGMDFGETVGKYSKPWLKNNVKIWSFKKTKFRIAKKLIELLIKKYGNIKVYIIPKNIGNIRFVSELAYEDINKVIWEKA